MSQAEIVYPTEHTLVLTEANLDQYPVGVMVPRAAFDAHPGATEILVVALPFARFVAAPDPTDQDRPVKTTEWRLRQVEGKTCWHCIIRLWVWERVA
jgi:hypothetical protein